MSKTRLSLGQRGEQLAADHLTEHGYEIVARNFRCPAGELDIVAKDGDGTWIIVEVRTRRGRKFGAPEESITLRKKAHLIAAAQTFLQSREASEASWRIDLAAVEFSPDGKLLRLEVIENAINEQ